MQTVWEGHEVCILLRGIMNVCSTMIETFKNVNQVLSQILMTWSGKTVYHIFEGGMSNIGV